MVLESLVIGLCLNVGHCEELSRQYFYYNPVLEDRITSQAKEYEDRARQLMGEKFMNGVVPFAGFLIKREATIAFPGNQSVTLKVNTTEIGVNYSWNF